MEDNPVREERKGGRPPKPESEKLSVRHNLKISIEDEVHLQRDYELTKQGRPMPFEVYLRERLLQLNVGEAKRCEAAITGEIPSKKGSSGNMNSLLVTLIDLKRTLQGVSTDRSLFMKYMNEQTIVETMKNELIQQINLSDSVDELIGEIKLVIHQIKQKL